MTRTRPSEIDCLNPTNRTKKRREPKICPGSLNGKSVIAAAVADLGWQMLAEDNVEIPITTARKTVGSVSACTRK
jgi:hypothetical protein